MQPIVVIVIFMVESPMSARVEIAPDVALKTVAVPPWQESSEPLPMTPSIVTSIEPAPPSLQHTDPSECKSYNDAVYGSTGCATKLPAAVTNVCFESIAGATVGTVLLHYAQLFCGPPPDDAGSMPAPTLTATDIECILHIS